jgi:hypothetical protein
MDACRGLGLGCDGLGFIGCGDFGTKQNLGRFGLKWLMAWVFFCGLRLRVWRFSVEDVCNIGFRV